ncbi:hypothetical protein OG884_18455 [Streptosporangium sp. NBC_01755]|uniref:hypothetical protein n=1 Tax=Streptosporangium sp. NBC_01755 TaxID=2975949 RepID=UPI002DD808E4|nr:hypothetical protein [Streptosporangium sp. NBC_01755]WSD01495.1 hypothetical protein OG884_06080 [Streptosporangium sp. NBC_01755]WSD03789.1 hypothetical protein OG884_18455 [Streptosporangium sp. NBC_01755]
MSDHLRHGYTWDDVDQCTRIALSWHMVGAGFVQMADRYHLAWSGIVAALYEAAEQPERADLIHAGWRALTDARDQELRAHGWAIDTGELRIRPRFAAYWDPPPGGGFEEAIVERLGLYQAFHTLTPGMRDAVLAVAATGSYAAAEQYLGITRAALTVRLSAARMAILRAWMEGETPARPRLVRDRKPIRCGTPHGYRAHSKRREKACEACRAARYDKQRETAHA